jgi:hypothetical protein
MARTKQLARPVRPSPLRSRPELARMTSSSRFRQGPRHQRRYKSSPEPFSKELKKSEMDPSAEVRALELDTSNNPFPESSSPRQPPAMTRYHGKPRKSPREKGRHPKSWRKRKIPPTLTDPKMSGPFPQTSLDDDPPPLTNSGDTHPTTPEVPATRRSEPRTQPEVIDLTGED